MIDHTKVLSAASFASLHGHLALRPSNLSVSNAHRRGGTSVNMSSLNECWMLQHMYRFNLTKSTVTVFDACQVNFDVLVYIYTADLSTQLASRDEGGCPRGSGGGKTALTHTLDPGSYVIVIEGYGDASSPYAREGLYNVTMRCTPAVRMQEAVLTCNSTVYGDTRTSTTPPPSPPPRHTFTHHQLLILQTVSNTHVLQGRADDHCDRNDCVRAQA